MFVIFIYTMAENILLSTYARKLTGEVLDRYKVKLKYIQNVDPYLLDMHSLSKDIEDFPNVHYFDLINYFKCAISPYSDQELRAIKSTKSYQAYNSGWVRDVGVRKIGERCLIMGKVLHSQRVTLSPLTPWIVSETNGTIICAHCNCVAGLGESCAHVGALLFAVEDSIRNYDPISVTGRKAYWMAPSKKVGEQSKLKSLPLKKRKLEPEASPSVIQCEVPSEPSEEERHAFLKSLSDVSDLSAILTVKEPFCNEIATKLANELSQYLTSLYDAKYLSYTLEELQHVAEGVNITLSKDYCNRVENETRDDRHKWFGFRSGRITASLFKRCCRTNVNSPSISLIKQICYPEKYSFSTVATRYGCYHEKDALSAYETYMKNNHTDFCMTSCGFIINPEMAYCGATPDALTTCSCHGDGCVEVKCPYCIRDVDVYEMRHIRHFCLKDQGSGMKLDRKHTYFYQVQMQMAVTERLFCDFVVWSKQVLYIERINFDETFWRTQSDLAFTFHRKVILPELLSKFFTQPKTVEHSDDVEECEVIEDSTAWCICRREEDGTPMIACDNINCDFIWYHLRCLKMTDIPESPWYCPACSISVPTE